MDDGLESYFVFGMLIVVGVLFAGRLANLILSVVSGQ
jgi:hypothetical protein